MTQETFVRVIVMKDGDDYIAQCLEYDICANASDVESALKRFVTKFSFERNFSIERNGSPFAGIDRAPDEYFDMWVDCSDKGEVSAPGSHITFAKCLEAA